MQLNVIMLTLILGVSISCHASSTPSPLDEITITAQHQPATRMGTLQSFVNVLISLWPFKKQTTAKEINVEPYNGVIDLSSHDIDSLELLDKIRHKELVTDIILNDNNLTELPSNAFSQFPHLERSSIRRNQLTTLAEDAFHGATKLKELSLSRNQLTAIPDTLFTQCTELTIADFSFNDITSISAAFFDSTPTLHRLNLRINPLADSTKKMLCQSRTRSCIILFDEQ